MLVRLYRRLRRLWPAFAAAPILQATGGCDPASLLNLFVSTGLQAGAQLNVAIFQTIVSSARQTLLTSFPGANFLQIILGGNSNPFF